MPVEPGQETAAIFTFLERIGIRVRREPLPDATFLPGLAIDHGTLVVDEARLLYPGDMLHEAGHLAVLVPSARAECAGHAGADAGNEMAAIAWSYAASVDIGLDPEVVFHDHGYSTTGGGSSLAHSFSRGQYIAVPLLQWFGMTREPKPTGGPITDTPGVYPRMLRWLREEPEFQEEQAATAIAE